ncbi:cytosine permease [Tardisphaera miroshnichenkoae]
MKEGAALDLQDYNQGTANVDQRYFNENLAPVPRGSRDWSWVNFTTVWAGMVHNVVQFEIAGLLTFEFGPIIALVVTALAYGTELVAMYLNGHMGAKWGIPFPTSIRASYGIKGSYVPIVLRAFSALFFFAIQTYVGATLISSVMGLYFPWWSSLTQNVIGMPLNLAISFVAFWFINLLALFRGMKEVKYFELVLGPVILASFVGMMAYGLYLAHGLQALTYVSSLAHPSATPYSMALAVASLAGAYSTLVLNIMDFTRFAKSQRDQVIGQAIGFPVIFVAFSFVAAGTISSIIYVFHVPSSEAMTYVNPVNIMYLLSSNKLISAAIGLTLIAATVGVNVAANLVSPVYDVLSFFPRLNWRKAAVLASLLGVAFAPWYWYTSASNILSALNVLGSALGSVAGVMMVDYWIIRKRNLSLADLFQRGGAYWYKNGINAAALVATVAGAVIPISGALLGVGPLSDFGWYLALFVGGGIYLVLAKVVRKVPRWPRNR